MRRIFVMFICFIVMVCLIGCDSNNKMVNVTFYINEKTYIKEIQKETILNENLISSMFEDINEVIVFYYDKDLTTEYNNEPIIENIKLYAKVGEEAKYYLEESIKREIISLYYNSYCSSESNIELVELRYYYGIYNDGHIVLINNKTKGHPADGRGYEYHVLVYKDNKLIPINEYLEYLSYEDYLSIITKAFDIGGK